MLPCGLSFLNAIPFFVAKREVVAFRKQIDPSCGLGIPRSVADDNPCLTAGVFVCCLGLRSTWPNPRHGFRARESDCGMAFEGLGVGRPPVMRRWNSCTPAIAAIDHLRSGRLLAVLD